MNFKEYLVMESIKTQKYIVVYGGRFQPFHKGHEEIYDSLVSKFGKNNVYITTSNKVEEPKSPFNFEEKKEIITTMFPSIPKDHIIQVKNNYNPVEILDGKPEDVVVIFVIGDKDAERLSNGKYMKKFTDGEMNGWKDNGYVYPAPKNTKVLLSGTQVRDMISKTKDMKETMTKLYGTYNKKIANLLKNKIMEESVQSEGQLINEGGSYGHLSNFHEVRTNTFAELKEFIDTLLQGKMEMARLKTDGMNLMFSWVDNQLKVARNTSDLKNFGENALTEKELAKKFEGRGPVLKSFISAYRDLAHAIGSLPKDQREEMFGNGHRWMSVEVMHPETENIIPYGVYELRMHGVREYDANAKVTGDDKEAADKLSTMLKNIKADKQSTFNIKSLAVANLPVIPNYKTQRAYFNNKVKGLMKKYKVSDENTFQDAFNNHFSNIIKQHAKEEAYTVPTDVLNGLTRRWAGVDKSFKKGNIDQIKNAPFREWVIKFDTEEAEAEEKKVANDFELLILELGAKVMQNLTSFMVANPDKAVQKIRKDMNNVIAQVNASNDPAMMDKIKYELNRLSAIGGMEAIAPEEGFTLMFHNQFWKVTGSFAPVNQIMNLKHKLKK